MNTEQLLERTIELNKVTRNQAETKEFNEWIEKNGISNYDGHDRWLLGRRVVGTKTLYTIFQNANENFLRDEKEKSKQFLKSQLWKTD